jgi:LacI family transcriptional regulator
LELSDPPTAIFAANNRICVGVLRALSSDHREISVVGFDELELAITPPMPLAAIRYDAVGLGRRAAELLFDRLNSDEELDGARSVIMPTSLLVYGR